MGKEIVIQWIMTQLFLKRKSCKITGKWIELEKNHE